jgi:peptidoglycan/LPS O-acetylase OafA/YrhL
VRQAEPSPGSVIAEPLDVPAPERPLPQSGPRIDFIALLRGSAVLFVIYAHFVGDWLDENKLVWPPLETVRAFVTQPLAIIQDFGFFGVMVFFLVSGFIITHVGQRESRLTFLIRRLLRIYPPLIVSIVVIALIAFARHAPMLSFQQYLIGMTLVNYVMVPSIAVNGVAWSLVIEMIFYFACAAILPLVQKAPAIASVVLLTFSAACIFASHSFGASFFLFAVSASYLPFLILGQLVYFRWNGRMPFAVFAALTALAYVVAILGIRIINAYLIFVLAAALCNHIRLPRFLSWTATISYSLYLFHGVIGLVLIDILAPVCGYSLALAVALAVVFGASELSYRFVELPSQRIARRLTGGGTRAN